MKMNLLTGAAAALVSALALTLSAPAAPRASYPADAPRICPGCVMTLTGPNYGDNGAANPCGTDLRLTLLGKSGLCYEETVNTLCRQLDPCKVTLAIDYKSTCTTLTTFDANGEGWSTTRPGTGGVWTALMPATTYDIACGTPLVAVYVRITDTSGFSMFGSGQFWCSECEN